MKTAPEQNQCVTIAETQRNTAAPLFCFFWFCFCLASDRSVRQSPSVTLRALDEDQHHGQLLAPGGRHESSEPEGGSRKEGKAQLRIRAKSRISRTLRSTVVLNPA